MWRDHPCTPPREGDAWVRREAAAHIVKDYELVALHLDEEQALVLSFVDGSTSVAAIAACAALPVERVRAIVHALVAVGALALGDGAPA